MRLRSLLSVFVLTILVGCAAPEVQPTPPAPPSPIRMLFPRYVTHAPAPVLGGAAWRGTRREHALDLDGQACGLTDRGRVRCQLPTADPPRPASSAPAPTG